MNDFWDGMTPASLLTALAAGLVFGAALPYLVERTMEDLIPRAQVDILNRAAGLLVPLIVIPLGGAFWIAQTVEEASKGGPWQRVAGRFVVFVAYVLTVTVASLMSQRARSVLLLMRTNAEAKASDMRLSQLRRDSVADEMRRTEHLMTPRGKAP